MASVQDPVDPHCLVVNLHLLPALLLHLSAASGVPCHLSRQRCVDQWSLPSAGRRCRHRGLALRSLLCRRNAGGYLRRRPGERRSGRVGHHIAGVISPRRRRRAAIGQTNTQRCLRSILAATDNRIHRPLTAELYPGGGHANVPRAHRVSSGPIPSLAIFPADGPIKTAEEGSDSSKTVAVHLVSSHFILQQIHRGVI